MPNVVYGEAGTMAQSKRKDASGSLGRGPYQGYPQFVKHLNPTPSPRHLLRNFLWASPSYADNGNSLEALQLSERFQSKGLLDADEFTFLSILKACSSMAASHQGRLVHAGAVRRGLEKELVISNTLVSLYAKCGSLIDAHIVFDKSPARSTVSFNAMIAGCAEHGLTTTAYIYLEGMQRDGVEANDVTFVSLLTGCSHAGLIEQGYYLLHSMEKEFNLIPRIQHFVCVVDILGRVGCLDEAIEVVFEMPFEPDCRALMALLSSCEKHGYLQQGGEVFDWFVQESHISAAAYVLMSNIFAANADVEVGLRQA